MRIANYGIQIDIPDVGDNRNNSVANHMRIVFKELFVENIYDFAEIKDRYVVDVGAFCGETAVYFSKKGAKKVYALEPFGSFNMIASNAALNNCNNIVPIKGAMSYRRGRVLLNPDFVNDGAAQVSDAAGVGVDCYGLQDLVDIVDKDKTIELMGTYSVMSTTSDVVIVPAFNRDYVLKIDCEGGEFKAIPTATKETLRCFEYIMGEYHNHSGRYQELVAKLERCGFEVFTLPHYGDTGLIYAHRMD